MAINFKTSSHIASILAHAARTVRNGSTLKSARGYMHYQLITRVEAGQVEGVDVGHCTGAYALQAVLRSKADFLAHCDREAAYWDDVAKEAITAQRAAKAAREAEDPQENNMKALKPFTVVLSESDDASSISVRQVMAADEEVAVLAAKKEWYADQTCGWNDEYLEDYPFHPKYWDVIAVVAAATAHDEQAAPVIEEYRTAVLSTAHMMESDYQILTDNAAQVGSDDGLFWIHDTQAGAILRFKASYYAVGELASLGASRLLIDTILRLEKLGYQAAHFDRDADRVTGWPVDPQYSDENE